MLRQFFYRKNKSAKAVFPDQPIEFGYKNKWLAIKSSKKEDVAQFLNLKNIKEANWKDGVEYGYEKGVFITPEIQGWILVLGIDISDLETNATRNLLKRTSKEFGECQIFLTHRGIEYHFWGLAKNGSIERLYSFFVESGNIITEGKPTKIERSYNLVNTFLDATDSDEYWKRKDLTIPDEETVMKIAENWSINPSKIENYSNIKGTGLIGKFTT